MLTTLSSSHSQRNLAVQLLTLMYGQEFDPTQISDEHIAALNNIIQTELTSIEQAVITNKHLTNNNVVQVANTMGMTLPKLKAIENDILFKLRSHILPVPIPIAIEAMGLSQRVYNSLKRANINTLGELNRRSDDDLLTIRNLGQTGLSKIRTCVQLTLEKRIRLYENCHIIDYKNMGVCPVCNGTNHDTTRIDNGYDESYYNVKCNDCGATWHQTFHTVIVNDDYDEAFDSDGNPIKVLIENKPKINIDDMLQNAQLCYPCTANCALNPNGVCHYPLIYGRMPDINCRKGLSLK